MKLFYHLKQEKKQQQQQNISTISCICQFSLQSVKRMMINLNNWNYYAKLTVISPVMITCKIICVATAETHGFLNIFIFIVLLLCRCRCRCRCVCILNVIWLFECLNQIFFFFVMNSIELSGCALRQLI